MLRLQQKTINPETATAMTSVSQLIALISKKHKLLDQGKIDL